MLAYACRLITLVAVLTVTALAAELCAENVLLGSYGFQLSGETMISVPPAAVAGIARIVFAEEGKLSGYSSINFNGLLLGNPVTGTYEVKSDCSLSFSLQDDSGAFQHFSGAVRNGGNRAEFHQTDPGTNEHGIMGRTSDACKLADIRGQYGVTMSGASIPMDTGGPSTPVAANGVISADPSGTFAFDPLAQPNNSSAALRGRGTFEVDSDCIVRFDLARIGADGTSAIPVKLRGILVNGGAEILAIQTDAGETVAVRFIKR